MKLNFPLYSYSEGIYTYAPEYPYTAKHVRLHQELVEPILQLPSTLTLRLNLARTDTIDSVGIAAIISLWKLCGKMEKHFSILGVRETIFSTLELCGLTQTMEIHQLEKE